jgi:serine/threonine protein kinase
VLCRKERSPSSTRADLRPVCDESCPKGLSDLIHECLQFSPSKRPNANDIVTRINDAVASHTASQRAIQQASSQVDARVTVQVVESQPQS